jgi:hypothetical protein
MHHSLRFYGQHQHNFLHIYISLARLAKVPVIGRVVRWAGNTYAFHGHSGYYLTLSQAEQIVDIAKSVSVGPCSCRQEFHNCNHPVMSEIVLENGSSKVYSSRLKELRAISKKEAKEILQQAHMERLTHSIMRCGDYFYAICSCCSCCCVPTRLRQQFGIGQALIRNTNVVEDFQRQQLG